MGDVRDVIDFKSLEKELEAAIEKDKLYWQQNDAKIRAASDQRVTYDEFREIVNAAHLKPLDKSDKLVTEKHKVIWNPVCNKKKSPDTDAKNNLVDQEWSGNCVKSVDLVKRLRSASTPGERFEVLRRTGPEETARAFRAELPPGVFGEVLEALAEFPPTTHDVALTVRLLEALATTNRFSLSLEFLSCGEKSKAVELMEKLSRSLGDRQQDLAEQGVTEWSITSLRSKYRIPPLVCGSSKTSEDPSKRPLC